MIDLKSKESRSKVEENDYLAIAGVDWPSYRDFLSGAIASDPRVQEEIDHLVSHQNNPSNVRFVRKVVKK
jgi:hypothetical protein